MTDKKEIKQNFCSTNNKAYMLQATKRILHNQ